MLRDDGSHENPGVPFPHWNADPLIPTFSTPQAQLTHEHRLRNLPAEVDSTVREVYTLRLLLESEREQRQRLQNAFDEQRAEFGRLSRSVGSLFIQVNADGLRLVELQDVIRDVEPRTTTLEGEMNDVRCWMDSEIKERLDAEEAAGAK
jgi:hypothetical protein